MCCLENKIAHPARKYSERPCATGQSGLATTSGALRNVCRLWSLLSFRDFELHRIALLQAFIALGSDRAVMHENVGTIRAADEPVAFCVIEPLYRAFQTFHVPPLSARPSVGGPKTCPHRMHFGAIREGCQGETVEERQQQKDRVGTAASAVQPSAARLAPCLLHIGVAGLLACPNPVIQP